MKGVRFMTGRSVGALLGAPFSFSRRDGLDAETGAGDVGIATTRVATGRSKQRPGNARG